MRHVDKPWGHETIWVEAERFVGKILFIRAGERLSLQFHRTKDEALLQQSGEMELLLDDEAGELQTRRMVPGDTARILPGRRHRITAITDCEILELSTPELDDVVRLEDDYGRVPDDE